MVPVVVVVVVAVGSAQRQQVRSDLPSTGVPGVLGAEMGLDRLREARPSWITTCRSCPVVAAAAAAEEEEEEEEEEREEQEAEAVRSTYHARCSIIRTCTIRTSPTLSISTSIIIRRL